MNRDDLEALREGWDFEVKLGLGRDGLGAVPESLWETYSAMANGGVILLGTGERPDGSLERRRIRNLACSVESSEESRSGSAESGSEPRAPREQQLEALLAYFSGDWRKLPPIAAALRRTDGTVRTMYLQPLLAQGTLGRLCPESPRHPMQVCRTARKAP